MTDAAISELKTPESGRDNGTVAGTHQGKNFKLRKRLMPNGDRSPFWAVDFELQGKRVIHSTGTGDKVAAMKVAQAKVAAALSGRWEQLGASKLKAEVATVGEIVAAYRAGIAARTKVRPRTIGSNVSMLRTIVRAVHGEAAKMEGLRSSILTRELLQQYKEARFAQARTVGEQERARTSTNSTLAQARSLFSKAALELYQDRKLKLPDLTGFLGVTRFKDDRDVSFVPIAPAMLGEIDAAAWALLQPDAGRVLGDGVTAEERRLCPARPDIFLAYILARYVGMRDIEIVNARWEWLTRWPEGWRMEIIRRAYYDPKGSEGRVTIGEDLHALLQAHGDRTSLWILPATTKTGRFDAVYRDANAWLRQWLPDREKGMHELRKQAGSEVYTREHSLSAAAEFLRNKEETCRKHYAKLLVPLRPLALMRAG